MTVSCVDNIKMDDIAFNDWPTIDINTGTNSWFPAYGFQPPAGIIEREDFLGNPDADYFLNGTSTPCLYLETIHEETSDDLRSDSEISTESPLGWLATDSETDSVICMDANNETDCESDREIACPAKRRRQDNFLTLPTVDIDDYQSISRTSSLIQFETLEQQCQETSTSTPSIYSQFSFDSLEAARKHHQDSNNNHNNNNNNANSDSDICDNETALSGLKAWHSFDNLLPKRKDKFSAENLSEDSGYGEQQMTAYNKFLKPSPKQKSNFCAYDCEIFQQQISGNFSASRQNLSIFTEDDDDDFPSRLLLANHHTSSKQKLILERSSSTECVSKYTTTSSSTSASSSAVSVPDLSVNNGNNKEYTVVYSSVPKDLHLLGDRILSDDWGEVITTRIIQKQSIATTNCDLADFADVMENYRREGSYSEAMRNRVDLSDDEHSLCYNNNNNNSNNNNNNKRRASYKPKTTLEVFDRKILQVISESIQSMNSSQILDRPTVHNTSNRIKTAMRSNHNAVSTPNLALKYHESEQDDEIMDILMDEERRRRSEQDIRRKSYSTNSGVSDFDERNNNIKEVHFSPVVSEVNWQDDDNNSTTTAERESSYSLSTTPESELIENFTRALLDDTHASSSNSHNGSPPKRSPKRQQADLNPLSNTSRLRSRSQPDMSKNNNNNNKLNRRRGSLLVKKEKDGTVVKAYVDSDGIQYKHTHLDDDIHGRLLGASTKYHSADLSPPTTTATKSSKLSHVFSSTSAITTSGGNVGSSTTDRGRHGIITTTITKSQPVGVGMDADVVVNVRKHEDDETKKHNNKTAKLGGFFSRLASFRFTNKKGGDKKGKKQGQTDSRPRADALLSDQRIATKEDYIYIPLKGPSVSSADSRDNHRSQSNNEQNGQIVRQQQQQQPQQSNTAGARKPPLPRAPPRVVGASVKRNDSSSSNSNAQQQQQHHHRPNHHHHHQPQIEKQQQQHHQHHHQQQQQQQHRRRRTIDSAESCPRPMEPMGLIETDLDTEVTVITSGANVKTRSLMNLGAEPRLGLLDTACNRQRRLNTNDDDNNSVTCHTATGRPHKSMEFLLDKQNLKVAEPPENELQKGERVMSEHQLRVQRSLQKLNVPDWYKQSQIPREGFLLKKSNRETRWTGTSSGGAGGGNGNNKTTSLSSLGSNLQSPIILSPNNSNNNNQTQPFVRWSTSKLNSTASSPCASLRSSFNARQPNGSISPSSSVRSSFSYRQPYLGWRSQERLTRPRTPAERLANSLLNQQQQQQQKQQEDSPEIQTSIKEVTSAIVHYVSGLKPPDSDDNRSESASPRGSQKFCWLESSFVGIRPLDSPETPVGLSENETTTTTTPQPPSSLRLDLEQTHNDMKLLNTGPSTKLSPGSTTLEDVLDSLLGLPSSDRAPSPSLQGRRHVDGVS